MTAARHPAAPYPKTLRYKAAPRLRNTHARAVISSIPSTVHDDASESSVSSSSDEGSESDSDEEIVTFGVPKKPEMRSSSTGNGAGRPENETGVFASSNG